MNKVQWVINDLLFIVLGVRELNLMVFDWVKNLTYFGLLTVWGVYKILIVKKQYETENKCKINPNGGCVSGNCRGRIVAKKSDSREHSREL